MRVDCHQNDKSITTTAETLPEIKGYIPPEGYKIVTMDNVDPEKLAQLITNRDLNMNEKFLDISATNTEVMTFPDGGFGWLIVFGAFMIQFCCWGFNFSWGVYQEYYIASETFQGSTLDNISWCGGIGAASVFLTTPFQSSLVSRIGLRKFIAIGIIISGSGMIAASFVKTIWQLYLTQGLMFGLGAGMALFTSVAIPVQWFDKRRGLASGITVAGSGIGGAALAPLNRYLITHVGYKWALRVMGIGAITIGTLMTFGYLTPIFLLPKYVVDSGLDPSTGATLVSIFSGVNALARIVLGHVADIYGPMNVMILGIIVCGLSCYIFWMTAHAIPMMVVFVVFYGINAGSFVSLFPVVAAKVIGVETLATAVGLLFSGNFFGNLLGTPLASAIISASGGSYTWAIVFAGTTPLLSAILLMNIRFRDDKRIFRARTGATPNVSTSSRKRVAVNTRTKRSKHSKNDEDEDDIDSEKEIETVKDYEDAVRRRILSSTTNRYDDVQERDHLTYAASLMMPAPEPQPIDTQIQPSVVYSLGTFCLHAITKDFKYLASDHTAEYAEQEALRKELRRNRQSRQNKLDSREYTGESFRRGVQTMPYYLAQKLFRILKYTNPELLSTKIWTSLFFPPDTTTSAVDYNGNLTKKVVQGSNSLFITELDLEGIIASQVTDGIIKSYIIHTLNLGPQLERINLNWMDSLSDKTLAQLVGSCPSLVRLSLKGCTKVGDMTLSSLSIESLEELNISFVAAPTAKGIKQLIYQCRELRVLKMAGVVNIKDSLLLDLEKELLSEMEKLSDSGNRDVPLPLYRLENLKISSTKLGDRGFKFLMSLCGKTLQRLDISATGVSRISPITQFCIWDEHKADVQSLGATSRTTKLEKLNLTRLKIASPNDLLTLFKKLPPCSLHTLLIGYLTCGQVPIRDELFHQLGLLLEPCNIPKSSSSENAVIPANPFMPTPIVQHEFHLHTLSLFGNPQIGKTRYQNYGLHLLLQRLSPFLKRLELGYTSCQSIVLEGLLMSYPSIITPDQEPDLPYERELIANLVLEELGLDETPIGDDAAVVLSLFKGMKRLSLANTRIGEEAMEMIIQACPTLSSLDLTSCRGIPIMHRRTLLKDVRQKRRL
ncbi:hypothetical protein BGZ76_004601 [Entomortierella beljakovae]|nr:hypothetical protein BGZ76_004601 [Entomortierella beljakovae]